MELARTSANSSLDRHLAYFDRRSVGSASAVTLVSIKYTRFLKYSSHLVSSLRQQWYSTETKKNYAATLFRVAIYYSWFFAAVDSSASDKGAGDFSRTDVYT